MTWGQPGMRTVTPDITLVCVFPKVDTFKGHPLNWSLKMKDKGIIS